ncbi:MAG: thioredoxin family protein [Deltaproteobacteria bacterium]|nr:thioredoxin family protein [Deltaproteobacteria bacterium]
MKGVQGRAALVGIGILLVACVATRAYAGAEDWNDANIKWVAYEDGLKAAESSNRPICLIFFTSWCPHCANYSKVFSDPEVVKKSKSFVMVRADAEKNHELSDKFKPDGAYIPRTYFLSPRGVLDESLSEGRDQYKYFYDEHNPSSILAGMDRALRKLVPQ